MAPLLNIKVDVDGPLAACKELRENQIPFTIARALTMTADDARWALRSLEAKVFSLRNDWTEARTLVKMATKSDFTAQVYTDTANRKTQAPDYLPMQEEGGTKVPYGVVKVNGVSYIAVPSQFLRKAVGAGPIPTWVRPQNLLNGIKSSGRRRKGGMEGPTTQGYLVNGYAFFAAPIKGSKAEIAVYARRQGAWDNRKDSRGLEPWWYLVNSVSEKPIFPAMLEVEKVVQDSFPGNFSKAATEVMGNDLLRGSGVSVRL
jgi:hypothetical protein